MKAALSCVNGVALRLVVEPEREWWLRCALLVGDFLGRGMLGKSPECRRRAREKLPIEFREITEVCISEVQLTGTKIPVVVEKGIHFPFPSWSPGIDL